MKSWDGMQTAFERQVVVIVLCVDSSGPLLSEKEASAGHAWKVLHFKERMHMHV